MPTIKQLQEFGAIWSAVWLAIAVWPALFGTAGIAWWALLLAVVFAAVSLLQPRLFHRLRIYQAWMLFGTVAGHVNSRIIMALLFFVVFSPIGILMRLFGRDPLRRAWNDAPSYFIDRTVQPGSMKNQF